MAPLAEAAQFEREIAPVAMVVIVLLIGATAFVHHKWFAPLTLPAMLLPLIFLGDMYFWLRRFGQGLDPNAALSSSIKPFTPTLLGHGAIGQFSTDAPRRVRLLAGRGRLRADPLRPALPSQGPPGGRGGAGRRNDGARVVRTRCVVGTALALALWAGSGAVPTAAAPGQASPATGDPTGRTWVVAPGDGDVITLRKALARAAPGDTIRVLGGVYAGPFVIDKALHLVGIDRPVLDGGGEGTVITFLAPGSVLEGFRVTRSGALNEKEDSGLRAEASITVRNNVFEDVLYGINLKAARDSVIEGNHVSGRDIHVARRGDGIRIWESHGTRIVDNTVVGARDVVIWYSEDLEIRGNEIREGRYGLHYMYSHDSRIADNRLLDNAVGGYLMYSTGLDIEDNVAAGNHGPSGYGLAFKDSDRVAIRGNVLVGNRVGLYLDNTPSRREVRNAVANNTMAWNDIGTLLLPSVERNDFAANAFVENHQHVALSARGTAEGNDFTPGGIGNYWSGYAGFDANTRDGIGDLPYRQISLFDDLLTRKPSMRLFTQSPAQVAIDLAARAFPVFQPPPLLVDEAPLLAPPAPSVTAPPADGRPAGRAGDRDGRRRARGAGVGARPGAASPRAADGHATRPPRCDMSDRRPMIEISHMQVRFGRSVVLDDLSLTLGAGESLALWGVNGAGKTTALRALLGLVPFRGEARVAGFDVRRHGRAARAGRRLRAAAAGLLGRPGRAGDAALPGRPARRRGPRSSGRAAGARRPDRPRPQARRRTLGRHAAAAGLVRRAAGRPPGARARRADRQPGPRGPARLHGASDRAACGRQDAAADLAPHRGGPGAGRSCPRARRRHRPARGRRRHPRRRAAPPPRPCA